MQKDLRILKATKVSKNNRNDETLSLFDVCLILIKRRKMCVIFFILFYLFYSANILIPNLSIKDYYQPKADFIIRDSISSLKNTSANTQDIMEILSSGSDEEKEDNSNIAALLLNGNTLIDRICDEFNFIKHYKLEKSSPADAKILVRLAFQKNMFISGSSNYLCPEYSISYRDEDPAFATNVVNRTIEVLKKRIEEVLAGRITMKKARIIEMLKIADRSRTNAQNKLILFNIANGPLDSSGFIQPVTDQIADLNSEIIKKEIELQTLLEYFSEDSPKILLLKNQIEDDKAKINELKNGFPDLAKQIMPATKFQELTMDYINLKSDFEIQDKIFTALKEEEEKSKIEENDNDNILQIIETAEYLKIPTGPNRFLYMLLGFFACIFFSVSAMFLFDYIHDLLEKDDEVKKWNWIKSKFRFKKKHSIINNSY
jgi:capsular polysaccharide biosynthesis protein